MCGEDVGAAVGELLMNGEAYVKGLPPRTRRDVCDGSLMMQLAGKLYFRDAWDIPELAWQHEVFRRGECGTCSKTVTLNGACYGSDDVNYSLLGWMAALCGKDVQWLDDFADKAVVYRALAAITGDRAGYQGRMLWTLKGYNSYKTKLGLSDGDPGVRQRISDVEAAAKREFANCKPCKNKYGGNLTADLRQWVPPPNDNKIHRVFRRGEPHVVDASSLFQGVIIR